MPVALAVGHGQVVLVVFAALAIPAIIAEGHGRPGAEPDTHLLAIVEDCPHLKPQVDVSLDLLDQTSRMIMSIYRKL